MSYSLNECWLFYIKSVIMLEGMNCVLPAVLGTGDRAPPLQGVW